MRHATVGKPQGGTEFRIVNGDGLDVILGKVGELIGRGPCCVSGYIGTEGSDRWKAGWFHTGDLAWIDKLGHVIIVGRLKEVIVRGGGDKVSPANMRDSTTHPSGYRASGGCWCPRPRPGGARVCLHSADTLDTGTDP